MGLEQHVSQSTAELAQVNQELQRQREWFRTTLSSIGDAVIATGTAGEVLFMNAVAESLTGWQEHEAAGRPLPEVFHIVNEHTRVPAMNPATRAISEGAIVGLANHTVLIAKDGTQWAIDDSAAPIRDEHGHLLGAVLVFRDIGARRRAEQTLRESEQRYRSLFDNNLDPIFSLDAEGRFFRANAAAERVSGYTQQELKETHFLRLCDAELREEAAQAFRDGLCRKCRDIETAIVRKDGSRADLFVTGAPVIVDGQVVGVACIARDITDRKAAEVTRASLAAIIEGSDDAIVGKTLDGIVTSWNAGAERIFGYSAAEMRGQNITRILPPDRQDEEVQILARLRRGERIDHYESKRRRKDGQLIDVSVTISPIRDSAGRLVGASKIARDITRQKEAEAALKAAERNKDEFLAMLGHELRNPLAPLRNAVELMRHGPPGDAVQTEARGLIERQVHHLTRLVDDLLDVSRITRGLISLRRDAVDLAAVVSSAAESARPLLQARRHKLEIALPDEPLQVFGDATRLAQVLSNLLQNAAKYTPEGGHVSIRLERSDEQAVISVKDDGMGIAPALLERVFDLFAQAERSLDRSEGGLGIGLTIVRRLIQLHGGSVQAFSDGAGCGSEFVVRLPLLQEPIEAQAPLEPPLKVRDADTSTRILVVDDNVDAARTLELLLTAAGHPVRTVHDGANALACARDWSPDVVLLDIGLPGMTGYEVATRLRAAHFTGRLIAITGYGQAADRQRAAAAGFDLHLVKPVDPEQLKRLLRRPNEAIGRLK